MLKVINEKDDFEGKKILVRVGVNVPLGEDGKIDSDFRLKKILPTIKFLVEKKAKIILMGHIGREPEMTLKPIFE